MATKTKLVLDTNILLRDTGIIRRLVGEGFNVVINMYVLEELDKFKSQGKGELGYLARKTIRELNDLRKEGVEIEFVHRLVDGYETILKDFDLDPTYRDNKMMMLEILRKENVKLVTNDRAMLYKAQALGLEVNYIEEIIIGNETTYTGEMEIEIDDMAFSRFRKEGWAIPEDLFLTDEDFYPNQLIMMKKNGILQYGRYTLKQRGRKRKFEGRIERLIHFDTEVYGIKALDEKQQFLLDVLNDKSINVVTVSGKAGTGKTLLSLAYALEQSNLGTFDRVLLGKNISSIDKQNQIGFLPGDKIDKLIGQFGNYTSNIKFLEKIKFNNIGNGVIDGQKELLRKIEENKVDLLDISSILGASIDNELVIVDEAQSFDYEAIKSIITRIKDNSKLIILGDIEQKTVANPREKGFRDVINKLKKAKGVAHITLDVVHRGETQKEIAELLGL